jgi:virulence-associated protein VagC
MADIYSIDTCREFCQMVKKIVIYPIGDERILEPRQTPTSAAAAAAPEQDPKTEL